MPEKSENFENEAGVEEDYALQLAAEQESYQAGQELAKIAKEGQFFGHPSYLKYGFLFTLAAIIDIVDLLDTTGVGIFLSKMVSFFLSTVIIATFWLTNTKRKKAQEYTENLGERIQHLQLAVARTSRRAMAVSKFLGKTRIPAAKRLGRGIARGMVKIRRLARKNPATKILIGGALNLIPILAIFNIMVVWIYFVYRDEKKVYSAAKEASEEATQEIEIPLAA